MCGIAGMLKFPGSAPPDHGQLRAMCDVMVHRGPDDEGIYLNGPVGLGMRRLSIVDLSTGHQPISNEDGTIWIVFNGEIYNHRKLRDALLARGHTYRTQSDTETIIHLYEEYGRDCVRHLNGMFAFAIWDERLQKLFVARDRLGIKPLYYRLEKDRFVFGSEIKVVLASESSTRAFDHAALPEFLAFGYLSGEGTFYSGVRKLLPGHWLEVTSDGKLTISQYWDLDTSAVHTSRDESFYVRSYRELLEEAVSSHLMSDVPLGVFLSGGLDSSAVAALVTKLRGQPVESFSVGYTESAYSELPYAQSLAAHIGAIHHEVLVSESTFFDSLPHLIWHEDEPLVWPSSAALFFVARLAQKHVKVVLTGEGSDETLAGYTRYAFTLQNARFDRAYRTLMPGSLRKQGRNLLAGSPLIGATVRRKLAHTFLAKDGESWSDFYFDSFFSAFGAKEQVELLTPDVLRGLPSDSSYAHVIEYWKHSSGELLQRLLYTDIKTYLVELLMKQDNMSMAASIESRVPFLDHALVEFATRIPREMQIKGLAGKMILKRAVEDLLPHSIIYRKKMGFPTPWSMWLAGKRLDGIEATLLEPRSLDRGYFRPEAIQRLFREHRTKHRDNYDRIWRLLNLELWHRICLEGDYHGLPEDAEVPVGALR